MICEAAFIIGKIHVVKAEFDLAEARFQEARNLVAGADDWEVVQKIEKEMMNLYLVQGRVNDAKEIERQLNSLKEVIG